MKKKRLIHKKAIFTILASFLYLIINCGLSFTEPITDTASNTANMVTLHRWGLYQWKDNALTCSFYTYSNLKPTEEDVYVACGETVYETWITTPPCNPYMGGDVQSCKGLYIHYLGPKMYQLDHPQQTAVLPISTELVNCPAWGICKQQPRIKLKPNFFLSVDAGPNRSTGIYIRVDRNEIFCMDSECEIAIPATSETGIDIEYWGFYDDGVETHHQNLLVRNIYLEGTDEYLFEVMDDRWKTEIPGCAHDWGLFPSIKNEYQVIFQRPRDPQDLYTDINYTLLSGNLIWMGFVDASDCADGGLLENRAASPCGVEKARKLVIAIQNSFNEQILQSSQAANIPARILKGMVAQESQYWRDSGIAGEFGFGHITDDGVDLLLLWNQSYFIEMCLLSYEKEICDLGYAHLSVDQQEYLRGLILRRIGFESEFDLLAQTLRAGCSHTSNLVYNITKEPANENLTYEDLWRINLGIYNAGTKCMADAISQAWKKDTDVFNWKEISSYFKGDCQYAGSYFDNVIEYGSGSLDNDGLFQVINN